MKVTTKPAAAAAKSVIDNAQTTSKRRVKLEEPKTEAAVEAAWARYTRAADELLAAMGTVSWKRALCSWLAALTVGAGIGSIGGALIEMVFATSVVAATPLFVQCVLCVLAFIATMYVAMKAARIAAECVLDGTIERGIGHSVSVVRGWFTFSSKAVAS